MCEQLVEHLRGRGCQSSVLVKQASPFVCKLPSKDEDPCVLSIGSTHPHPVNPPLPHSRTQDTLLTFSGHHVESPVPGAGSMDTEIHVIPLRH